MNPLAFRQTLSIPGVILGKTGAIFDPTLRHEHWLTIGDSLKYVNKHHLWWLGDWIEFGKHQYGEKYKEALLMNWGGRGTLRNVTSVCREFEMPRRRDNLFFHHHYEVNWLDRAFQEIFLTRAENEKWIVHKLRDEVQAWKKTKTYKRKKIELEKRYFIHCNGRVIADNLKEAEIELNLPKSCKKIGTIYKDDKNKYFVEEK